jgi:ATP-binding cassette subfamily B protein
MTSDNLNTDLFNLAESILDEKHSLSYRLKGNSMYPTLKAGDVGKVDYCTPESLKIGDIVVFKTKGGLVGHRIINIKKKEQTFIFTTKGDNSPRKDTPFSSEDLLGKITSYQRNKRDYKMDSAKMNLLKLTALNFATLQLNVNNQSINMRNRWNKIRTIKQNLSVVAENSGKHFLINALISALQGILPFVVIVCIKSLIDVLTQTNVLDKSQEMHFYFLLIGTALVFLFNGILTEIRAYTFEKLSQSVIENTYNKLHQKHTELDLSHYENPEEQDKIHRAVQEASYRPLKMIGEILTGIKSVTASLFLVAIFASIKWYLIVLLIIAIIPGIIIRLKYTRKLYRLKTEHSKKEREMYYYNRILTGFPFAKEQKLFGFSDFFLFRFKSLQSDLFDEKLSLRKSELGLELFAQLFSIILIFISLGYVSFMKINGLISIGTVVLFFFAFQRGYSVLNDFFRSITQIIEDNTFLTDFIDFLNMPSKLNGKTAGNQPFSLQKEIKIDKVSFRYETSQRRALSEVNITIPAGKTVAFVGANGSGKTTLIKLLCGFYQPESGSIYFDGVDLNEIGQEKIRDHISAVFQDFALYNITALKNIGLGDSKAALDVERVKKAAHAAGIDEVLEKLPNGYNTLLGNLFKEGEELSIGQWQKMAIARAFYRNAPLLLMDEPSSALDAVSEQQIINSLKELSRDKTAVIISHRLTTVQWADLIYFFEAGEVVESGTHEQLMSLKGKYCSLFQMANNQFD